MKKILSLVLAVVLLCGCMLTLVACGGGLSGKYSYTDPILGGKTTYEFKGKNFTRTYTLGSTTNTATGTYEVTEEEEKTYITFTYASGDEEAKEDDGIKMELTKLTENDESYIQFGSGLGKLVKYKKEK